MSAYSSEDIDRLEPAYLKSFGLQEAPFSTVHDDKFMYLDAERAQRINMLQHMCRYSNLLLIVQGVHGVGKTALMQRFIQSAETDWQVCQITANTMIDAEQLLFQAAQGFGVRQLPQDASELQEMLYARVATFHHNDQTPILIIDDAHELPKEALLAIFNLADACVNDVNLLRIILFCEPQIEKIISSKDVKALRERVTHTMEVPPFDEESTAEYLKHRMAVAGFNGGSPFTPKLVKKIYRASHGIPAQINAVAHQILEEGDVQSEDNQAGTSEVYKVSAAQESKQGKPVVYITAAALLLVLALVFQDQINSLFDEVPPQVSEMDKIQATPATKEATTNVDKPVAVNKEERVSTELDLQERIISLAEPEANKTEEIKTVNVDADSKQDDATTSKAGSEKATTTESQVSDSPTAQPGEPITPILKLDSVKPAKVKASRSKQIISILGQGFTPNSEVVISWTDNEKKLAPTQVSVINENQIDISITVGMKEDDWTVRIIDPAAGESNAIDFRVVSAQTDEGYRKEKWVLAQNPSSFTLQLFGTNKQQSADAFIRQHKLTEGAGYFYTQRNGKDWYSVIIGAYADKPAAQQAVKTLPVSLKRVKPWLRRFDDIQASINASRKVVKNKKPKQTAINSPVAPGTSASQHEAWLWSQDPTSFTLQLLGARQSGSIEKFLRKYSDLNGKAAYFHTRHDTQDWYAVVYGVYPDRKQAQQAIKRLPQELQTASPWIRSFGSIHAELDRTE